MQERVRITCRITGRVQLVMFRDFSQRKARKLGLVGFARNEADGGVTVVVEGPREVLETYISTYLEKGSVLSRVDKVDVTWAPATNEFSHFSIRY